MAILQGEYAVGHIPRESSRVAWYFLRHGGEITCEITDRQRMSDVDGKGLEVRHAFTHFWGSQEIVKATTCEDYKQLGPAVYHSTGFLQSHNGHKRFLKMPRNSQCPFPGIVSNWQSHNSHKRVLKMPFVVTIVSIS